VGIFSLFGKKEQQAKSSAAKSSARSQRGEDMQRSRASRSGDGRTQGQRKTAHATALKIDEIESAMSSEFVTTLPGFNNTSVTRPAPNTIQAKSVLNPSTVARSATIFPQTKAGDTAFPLTTQFLLDGNTVGGKVALSTTELVPVIEEAAILFANGQSDMVEHVLRHAIDEDNVGAATHTVWAMLFDFYQLTGKQEQFEHLSIEFANKFETSPPAWIAPASDAQTAASTPSGATPTVPFSGKLDVTIVKQLERTQNLARNNPVLRLEFNRITEVDPIGCGLLLSTLKTVQKSSNDLILVGALELTAKIKAILQVGRRDETEAPWLLFLEILRLLNLEREFEETSMDYCITFEVSPPAFTPPNNHVTTALAETNVPAKSAEHFTMPATIDGQVEQLIREISGYATGRNPAILDCSTLQRVAFGAAGQLLTGLAPLIANGTTIEFHHVNHLVGALFNVIGLQELVRVTPRKS
jgi:ABC-type transporter Mla MlaB component